MGMLKSCGSALGSLPKRLMLTLLTIIVLILIPPISIALIVIYGYRHILKLYVRAFKPDFGKIMSTRSSLMATDDIYGEPKANLLLVLVLKGSLTADQVRKDIKKRILGLETDNGHLVYPELQQTIVRWMGYSFWKRDSQFNIEDHIYEWPELVNQDRINELSTEMLRKPFTRGRSPWEAIMFPNCSLKSVTVEEESDSKTVIFFSCHHSMADGFALIKFLAEDISLTLKERIELVKPEPVQRTAWRKFLNSLMFVFVSPYEMIESLIEAWDFNQCHLPESKLSRNILLAFSERIPLEALKRIKNSYGASFTGMLLTAFTGAVREFMLENKFKVPEAIHCVLPLPMPGHPDKLRNFMTTCFVRLPIGIPDPEERLKEIDASLVTMKESTLPFTMGFLLPVMGLCPIPLARILFKQVYTTALISNFPAPNNVITYAEHDLIGFMFTAGLLPGNIGIGFNSVSYNGYVRIQAAFNESIPASALPRTFMLDKVLEQLRILEAMNAV